MRSVFRRRRLLSPLLVLAAVAATGLPPATAQPAPSAVTTIVQLTGVNASAVVERVLETAGVARVPDPAVPAAPGWSAQVPIPDGAQSVGFVWDGRREAELQMRSHGPAGWSPWIDLHTGDDEPDAEGAGRPGLGPVWIGEGADLVEVGVEEGSLANFRLDAIRVSMPQRRSAGSAASAALATAPAALGRPSIISREAWGAEPWASWQSGCTAAPLTARPRLAIVHHTASTNSYSVAQSAAQIRAIQQFHVHSRGWCDVAYNFFVDRHGQIFEGRAGGVDRGVIGGHARGFNTGSIGTALLGTHTSSAVTDAEVASLRALLAWKLAHHGVDPSAHVWFQSLCDPAGGACKYGYRQWVLLPTIVTHRDVGVTSCPGDAAYPVAARLRPVVADIVLRSGPFHPLPGWTPDQDRPRVQTLDALGGLHPAGSATSVQAPGYWSTYPIARGITGTATRGYKVDGWGGVHVYGSATPVRGTSYWPGRDVARAIALGPSQSSGWVLDLYGGLHPFGGAPRVYTSGYWYGLDIARDVVSLPGGRGGYVLDAWGGLHPFGNASRPTGGPYWSGRDFARAVVLNPDGPGGYVLDASGGIHSFGGAPRLTGTGWKPGQDAFRDLVLIGNGRGYTIDVYGVLWPVGGARNLTHSMTWTGYRFARGVVAG